MTRSIIAIIGFIGLVSGAYMVHPPLAFMLGGAMLLVGCIVGEINASARSRKG